MKLVRQYSSLQDAQQDAMRLEGLGILTYISSENSHRMGAYVTGAFNVGLWSVLDKQHADAIKCLDDYSFIPATGLSSEELDNIRENGGEQAMKRLFKASLIVFLTTFAVVASLIGYAIWHAQ